MPELALGGAVRPPPEETDPVASRFAAAPDLMLKGPPTAPTAGFGATPQGQLIQSKESGGRNIPNYRFDPTHTAGGFYQITDTNWRHYAPMLGIDINQYPNAMSAPEAVQGQVAGKMYAESGMTPWSRAAGGAIDTGSDPGAALAERVRQGYITQAGGLSKIANEAISRLGKMDADLGESMKRVREALDKTEQAQETALKASQQPPQQPVQDAMQKMGGLATVVGILGGLLTKAPMRASINAGAAAIEAYNRNDLQTYQLAYGNWKTQTDMLFKMAQMNADHARDILADERLGMDERRTQLDIFLRAAGLGQLADAARTNGDKVVLDWYEKNAAAQRQYELHKAQIEATADYRRAQLDKPMVVQKPDENGNQVQYLYYPQSQRLEPLPEGTTKVGSGGQAAPDPNTVHQVAQAISEYRQAPMSGWAMRYPFGQQVMAEVYKLNPNYRETEFRGQTAAATTVGRRGATLSLASNAADQLIPVVEDLSKKVDRTSFPTINAILLAGRERVGDPNVVAFGQALNSLLYVYMRALNPSGIPRVADLERGQHMLQTAWSQGQLDAVLTQMKREIGAEKTAIKMSAGEMGNLFGSGGTPTLMPYKSPQDVYKAFDAGDLTKDEARQILLDNFGAKQQ